MIGATKSKIPSSLDLTTKTTNLNFENFETISWDKNVCKYFRPMFCLMVRKWAVRNFKKYILYIAMHRASFSWIVKVKLTGAAQIGCSCPKARNI